MWFWVLGFNLSELLAAALRYRIPSTSQTENCLQQRNAYAPISLQNI
jgi:hypothetical protein